MEGFENIWPIHAEFSLTKEDIAYYYKRKYLRAGIVSGLLAAVYAILFFLLGIYSNIPLYAVFAALIILAVYYLTKPSRAARDTLANDAMLTKPQVWDIEFPSITIKTHDGEKHVILWKEFFSFSLTPEQVSYVISPKRFLILPRRLLSYDQTKTLVTHSTNTILL